MSCQTHALCRHAVQIGRANFLLPVAAQVAPAEIVGDNEDHIWQAISSLTQTHRASQNDKEKKGAMHGKLQRKQRSPNFHQSADRRANCQHWKKLYDFAIKMPFIRQTVISIILNQVLILISRFKRKYLHYCTAFCRIPINVALAPACSLLPLPAHFVFLLPS